MHTPVLIPKGVHYNLDDSDRSPRWPWMLVALLLAGAVAGLLLTFRPRLGKADPAKRSLPSTAVATSGVAVQQALPAGPGNSLPRLPAALHDEVRRLIDGAEIAFRAEDLPSARRRYLEILDRRDLGAAAAWVEQRLGEIGMLLVLTPRPMPEKTEHVVQRGESVERIARQYGMTRELLMKSNDIRRPEKIQAGQRLLVLDKPRFTVAVSRGAGELRLFLNGKLLKRYATDTGQRSETPLGTCAIRSRQERPVAGCIRMRNADADEICLIVPEGTPVRVVE